MTAGWQSMSTAPRDGSAVLLLWPSVMGDASIGIGQWLGDLWTFANHECRASMFESELKGWMPLPDPPAEGG